ncbi:hypothetical protein [methane-oxidizing endosymbiont of Gigantopelta aegis]|uniref:hypothetical protein n=1 Tax=methane-oxidizing endosymbiont of Gigantopelta aegis TaxID=2794938 RepID=UPI0018DEB95F|nr:hypothetical protein [methane-oxidizing endosymbiont of Gigantopelta aegis]
MRPVYIKPVHQLLIGAVIVLLVAGGYIYFRYLPVQQKIDQWQAETEGFKRRLAKADDSPPSKKKIAELKKQLDELTQQAQSLEKLFAPIKKQLAPVNSQALKLKISQLARESGVYVRANIKVQGKPLASKKKQDAQLVPASEGWVARMSPGSVFFRPMQQLTLEGTYQALYAFIHGLSSMPYQVTVVKLSIKKSDADSPPGYPQRLISKVILAL